MQASGLARGLSSCLAWPPGSVQATRLPSSEPESGDAPSPFLPSPTPAPLGRRQGPVGRRLWPGAERRALRPLLGQSEFSRKRQPGQGEGGCLWAQAKGRGTLNQTDILSPY